MTVIVFLSVVFFLNIREPMLTTSEGAAIGVPIRRVFRMGGSTSTSGANSCILVTSRVRGPVPRKDGEEAFA